MEMETVTMLHHRTDTVVTGLNDGMETVLHHVIGTVPHHGTESRD